MLLDPTHKVPGAFVSRCNLCNPVVKEGPFCRSCSRAEQTLILSGSCASISYKCISALIVLPLLRSSGDSDVPCKEAKLQARIKPTAFCSAIDKENSIEFLLDFLHYLYNYYMVCTLFSHTYHVTHHVTSCDVML